MEPHSVGFRSKTRNSDIARFAIPTTFRMGGSLLLCSFMLSIISFLVSAVPLTNSLEAHSARLSIQTLTDLDDYYCEIDSAKFLPTNVAECRPALNLIRTYANFNRKQQFLIYPSFSSPRRLSIPPYSISTSDADCIIQVYSYPEDAIANVFSWQEVRNTATEILEYCASDFKLPGKAPPGLGGVEHIMDWKAV